LVFVDPKKMPRERYTHNSDFADADGPSKNLVIFPSSSSFYCIYYEFLLLQQRRWWNGGGGLLLAQKIITKEQLKKQNEGWCEAS